MRLFVTTQVGSFGSRFLEIITQTDAQEKKRLEEELKREICQGLKRKGLLERLGLKQANDQLVNLLFEFMLHSWQVAWKYLLSNVKEEVESLFIHPAPQLQDTERPCRSDCKANCKSG